MTELPRLTSRQHPLVKRFRLLATGSNDDGAILLDGEHLIAEAMDAGVRLEVLLTGDRHADLAARASSAGAQVVEATAAVIDAASPVRSPSGLVAIANWRPATLAEVYEPVVRATILAPATYIGTILELCQSRRGTQYGMDYLSEDRVEIRYTLPLARARRSR